ncbi:MAG TPA: hypothetical protein VHE34_03235 [Puia sp.]|uniref:hypothetical protein n=1 Tax=Puia sp. TaxID=2045100 RepID=UPI002BD547E6|nr:hypothetical protein [Puia sp.]HVU94205.1 hypothetical protein [Puia sp.]
MGLLLLLFLFLPGRDTLRWVVDKNSTLQVSGRTNVNRFSCMVGEYAAPDTICFAKPCRGARGVALSGEIRLPIDGFDCNNRMMTGEFRKALRDGQYPELSISFISLDRMPEPCGVIQSLKGSVEIGLSGVSRQFEIDYSSLMVDGGTIVLQGSRSLTFSDFGLVPPTKMGGLVRVKDNLDVHFTLCLRKL